jgi:RNA polymerase subunit RPABC4/transcription elongation factor Spt4
MAMIQFVQNYDDLSTDRGYQFKFYCDKCRNGHMSRFDPSVIGTAGSLLRAAGSIFGGVLGSAGHGAYEIQQAVGGKAHDTALETAVEEAKPNFTQCVRCGQWVCNEVCWNDERGLCTGCAPKTEVEIAAAQSEAQIEQIREKVRAKDQTKDLNLDRKAVARCPKCKAQTTGGKFCPECGATLAPKGACGSCGALVPAKAKFCPECGEAAS